jgi:hypothetical protein
MKNNEHMKNVHIHVSLTSSIIREWSASSPGRFTLILNTINMGEQYYITTGILSLFCHLTERVTHLPDFPTVVFNPLCPEVFPGLSNCNPPEHSDYFFLTDVGRVEF